MRLFVYFVLFFVVVVLFCFCWFFVVVVFPKDCIDGITLLKKGLENPGIDN